MIVLLLFINPRFQALYTLHRDLNVCIGLSQIITNCTVCRARAAQHGKNEFDDLLIHLDTIPKRFSHGIDSRNKRRKLWKHICNCRQHHQNRRNSRRQTHTFQRWQLRHLDRFSNHRRFSFNRHRWRYAPRFKITHD